jgi:hypothetical protein
MKPEIKVHYDHRSNQFNTACGVKKDRRFRVRIAMTTDSYKVTCLRCQKAMRGAR